MYESQNSAGFRRRWISLICTGPRTPSQTRAHPSPLPPGRFASAPSVVGSRREPASRLTVREREVAMLIALGLTNRQIAEQLVISPRTAENHIQHIFDKLGHSSRAQVAAWAAVQGLLAAA